MLRPNKRWAKDAKALGAVHQEGVLRSALCRSEWSENYRLHPPACLLLYNHGVRPRPLLAFRTEAGSGPAHQGITSAKLKLLRSFTKCEGGRTRKEGNRIDGFTFLIQ